MVDVQVFNLKNPPSYDPTLFPALQTKTMSFNELKFNGLKRFFETVEDKFVKFRRTLEFQPLVI